MKNLITSLSLTLLVPCIKLVQLLWQIPPIDIVFSWNQEDGGRQFYQALGGP